MATAKYPSYSISIFTIALLVAFIPRSLAFQISALYLGTERHEAVATGKNPTDCILATAIPDETNGELEERMQSDRSLH